MDTSTASTPIATPSIGRSSSTVFGSLKWWPSSNNSNRNSSSSRSSSNSSSSSSSAIAIASHSLPASPSALSCNKPAALLPQRFGSAANVAGPSSSSSASGLSSAGRAQVPAQKLRESKWFTVDETRVLCAVVEPGFVVEIREGQENESAYGVVQFKACKDKKPKPQDVDVYTIKATSAQTAAATGRLLRVVRRTLADLWLRGCTVRIQNFGDREHQPHSEKDIRNQIAFAQKAKQMLWQSSQHFAFWCRYGERQQDIRRKQVDALRFNFPLGIVH